jgi:hypothetical protein
MSSDTPHSFRVLVDFSILFPATWASILALLCYEDFFYYYIT